MSHTYTMSMPVLPPVEELLQAPLSMSLVGASDVFLSLEFTELPGDQGPDTHKNTLQVGPFTMYRSAEKQLTLTLTSGQGTVKFGEGTLYLTETPLILNVTDNTTFYVNLRFPAEQRLMVDVSRPIGIRVDDCSVRLGSVRRVHHSINGALK